LLDSLLLLTSLLLLPSLLLLLFHDAPGTFTAAADGVTSISITPAVASIASLLLLLY
jgi:hypothetical protein